MGGAGRPRLAVSVFGAEAARKPPGATRLVVVLRLCGREARLAARQEAGFQFGGQTVLLAVPPTLRGTGAPERVLEVGVEVLAYHRDGARPAAVGRARGTLDAEKLRSGDADPEHSKVALYLGGGKVVGELAVTVGVAGAVEGDDAWDGSAQAPQPVRGPDAKPKEPARVQLPDGTQGDAEQGHVLAKASMFGPAAKVVARPAAKDAAKSPRLVAWGPPARRGVLGALAVSLAGTSLVGGIVALLNARARAHEAAMEARFAELNSAVTSVSKRVKAALG